MTPPDLTSMDLWKWDVDWLHRQWCALVAQSAAPQPMAERWWSFLIGAYGTKNRHYHGLNHIQFLLQLLDLTEYAFQDKATVAYSIWFHDCIYGPFIRNPEEKSAKNAEKALLQLGVSLEKAEKCGQYIRATATHTPQDGDGDLHLFLDLDMAILATKPDDYERYRHAVALEYKPIPTPLFRQGRSAFLAKLRQAPSIFHTPELEEHWAPQARENIAREWNLRQTHRKMDPQSH